MWSWIFDSRQQGLANVLRREDPRSLAELMAGMFTEDFVLGMASGPLISQGRSRLGDRAWGLKCLDGLTSLAEVLGVVPVENPEQGRVGPAFDSGLPALAEAVEERLGFGLGLPGVGAPSGLAIGGRLIAPDTPDQIYAAVRIDQAMALHLDQSADVGEPSRFVEIGGGYGAMCFWFDKARDGIDRYTIVDLPIVNVIQGYFLGKALGPERISLYGEPAAQFQILPDFALGQVETPFDVYLNKDSLPEMPRATMAEYLRWGAANCSGFFYSYNQEAAAEFIGEQQGVVHRAVEELGVFNRVRRDRAWVRDGYVEEIYLPTAAGSSPQSPGS